MNKSAFSHLIAIVLTIYMLPAFSQEITQTIRGTVIDAISNETLPGANIFIPGSKPMTGTTSDENGKFRLENIPVGRVDIKVTYIGYHDVLRRNLSLTSGKELVLRIQMEEMVIQGEEVEIRARIEKDKPINEMAMISARSFTVEESQRYAGSRNDVARMASNFAGVQGADDARNDIVIRGNSPSGLLWRLEGADIPNPNHYAAFGTTGGPVSILNNNQLANSDFITGAFPAEYGNAIAGVFDLKMRNGNNEQHEFLGQIGFNGFELGAEGPISKQSGSSYLANYRYSTLEVFELLGVDFGTGTAIPKYQDGSFKINLPNTGIGNISVFGMGGISDISFIESDSEDIDSDDLYADEGFDLINGSDMAVLGMTHSFRLWDRAYMKSVLSGSYHNFSTTIDSIIPETFDVTPYYRNDFTENKLAGNFSVHHKINARHNYEAGFLIKHFAFNLIDSAYQDDYDRFDIITDYDGSTQLLQPFVQWQYKPGNALTFNFGMHYMHLFLNDSWSVEPRFGMKWGFAPSHALSFGYGLHSQMLPITVYLNQVRTPNGYYTPNTDLGLVKSHHFIAGYDWRINEYMRLKSEVYYQYIFDAAVDATEENYYSILNQGANFYIWSPDTLANDGTGHNYGMEVTLEHFLNNGLYFLLTGSTYESKYRGSDEKLRNTAFNGNYTSNFLIGKEFKLGKTDKPTNKLRLLAFDVKATYAGGQRYIPLEAIKIGEHNYVANYIENRAYSKQFDDYFRTDFRVAYRQNSKKITMEWAIDVQNIFNVKNIYSQNFNSRTGEITQNYQMGLLIVPQFRIEF